MYSVAERMEIVEAYVRTGSFKQKHEIFEVKFSIKGLLTKNYANVG